MLLGLISICVIIAIFWVLLVNLESIIKVAAILFVIAIVVAVAVALAGASVQ